MEADPNAGARRARLAVLVAADASRLRALLADLSGPPVPQARTLKGPEVGLMMVRGRIGGGGAPFNVGEAAMARCVVALPCGTMGFGHVLGRDGEKARLVATLDALGETEAHGSAVREAVELLGAEQAAAADRRARETAATRVEFFTMARENL